MAMRQRVAAANTSRPRQSIRPIYEDFQPHFDLKEEPDAHIIYIQLPGFLKEQVRITFVHAPGVIRVHGQRPIGNNRWSRFNQTFPLPQNCHESKIHGKFSNGVLTITLPKEVPKADPNKEEAAAATKPIQDAMPKTSAAAEAKPQKVASTEKDQIHAPPSQKPAVQPKVQKGLAMTAAEDPQVAASEPEAQKGPRLIQGIAETQDHNKEAGVVSAMTRNEKRSDEKRVITLSNTASSQPKPQKAMDEMIPPKTTAEEKANADYQKEVQDRYITEANEKPREPKNALSKEKETTHGDKSSVAAVIDRIAPNTLDQVRKKSKHFGKEKPDKDHVAAKQGMKNLDNWINNEDKQLLINVGAAVLVLVAFGAYTTYGLWCPGKPKN